MLARAQSTEAAAKDLTLREISHRDEVTSTCVASARSYFLPTSKQAMEEDDDFTNRKRTNEDSKSFHATKVFNKSLLTQAQSAFPTEVQPEEMADCCSMLDKNNHVKAIRTADMVNETMASEPKADDATIRKSGADFVPLLEGHAQFGKLGTVHEKNAQEELRLRNVSFDPNEGMRVLSAKIKDSEHPGWLELQNETSEEQKNRLKCFLPRHLTAQQWDKDFLLSNPN